MSVLSELGRIGGSSLTSVYQNTLSVVSTMGKAALHALVPDDFEYYMCALELIDSQGNTRAYMNFPVMPNNIMENKTQIATITKTNNGVVTQFNSSFNPRDISIQGTFGRKLRLVSGTYAPEDDRGISLFSVGVPAIDMFTAQKVDVRTGYGLVKILQKIVQRSQQLDFYYKPYVLVFYNYALNTHYIVEVMQDSYSQSMENNCLWYYSLEMKAVAPADLVRNNEDHATTVAFLQKVGSQAIASSAQNILQDVNRATLGSLNLGL
jgi:hypothetical protein